MAFQGMILTLEDGAKKVVFTFGGQVHEVRLPPWPGNSDSPTEEASAHEMEAAIVLQCFTSRAALELQHALAASSQLLHVPRMEVPSFAAELHGSFADLAAQLQECVQQRRLDDECTNNLISRCTASLLRAAATLGHASAAQQLLFIEPRAGADEEGVNWSPVHLAAKSEHDTNVLRLLLEAAPDLVWSTVVDNEDGRPDWTLMLSAARAGNVEAVRLLLQLAPELATDHSNLWRTPLHEAAASGSPEAVRLLLEAAPQTATDLDGAGQLPMHLAAEGGSVDCIRLLVDAGAPGLDVPDDRESLPLHEAAASNHEAAARFLLARYPAAAAAEDKQGHRPLHKALDHRMYSHAAPNAARALLHVSGLSAQQLLDLLAGVPADQQQRVQPLHGDVAAHMPLTPEQWQRVPMPCPGLGTALPAVLDRSAAEAGLLVAHLPRADRMRLRVAALSLHRLQGTLELSPPIPAALLGRMLALCLTHS